MKLHYEWEPTDIEGGVQVQITHSEQGIIAYTHDYDKDGLSKAGGRTGRFVLVALSDGAMYGHPVTAEELAAEFTKYNYKPIPR